MKTFNKFFFFIMTFMPIVLLAQNYSNPRLKQRGQDSTETRYFDIARKNGVKLQKLDISFKLKGKTKKVPGHVIGEDVVIEGDIIVGKAKELRVGPQTKGVVIGSGYFGYYYRWDDGKRYRWENGTMPYYLPSNHPRRSAILQAINKINNETLLQLVPRRKERDYVYFRDSGPNGPANSYVGKRGNAQTINIPGWASTGVVIHEIFHAAGMWHEHSRCDRDRFITVNYQNMTSGTQINFDRKCTNATDVGSYDYQSIMHYGRYGFSKNGLPTIVPNQNVYIGQRYYISNSDAATINQLYGHTQSWDDY